MAVTLDLAVSGGLANSTSGLSYAHNLASSATALTVHIGGYVGFSSHTVLTTHTVTVGTTPLQLLGIIDSNNTPGYAWTEVWGIIGPPTGSQTISVVENNGGTAATLNVSSASWKGVTQFGTPVVNYGNSSSLTSGNMATSTGNVVLSVQGFYLGPLTAGSGGTVLYNYPTSTTVGYLTVLAEYGTGTSTVALTSTGSSGQPWGVVSVNLIGGHAWAGNAIASATVSTRANGSFVGSVLGSRAFRTATASTRAGGVVTHLGSPLRYVGRYPDTDSVVVPVSYANADNASVAVTPNWVTQQVNIAAVNCVSQAWVLGQVANYQTQTQLTAGLSAYIPKSALGAHSGIAQSNSSNMIPTAQLPTVTTNSLATCYDAYGSHGSILVASGTSVTSTTQNINEIIIAQISVPDPGYPWHALPFAYVRAASGGASSLLTSGTGNIGCLTVVIEGNLSTFYGVGICTDDPFPSYYPLLPYGLPANTNNAVAGAMTPTTNPPLPPTTSSGQTVFQLGACNLPGIASSNNYIFGGSNLVFYILVVPAL